MPKQTITITSPLKGVNRVVGRESQPPDFCWDSLNVLPYDVYGRQRVAQRYGTVKRYPIQLEPSHVQGMISVNLVNYPGHGTSTGGGSTTYTEAFTSIADFQTHWSNVPSTWTISGGALTIPAGTDFTQSSTIPLIFVPTITEPGNVQVNITFQSNRVSAGTDYGGNVWIGLNSNVPTWNDIDGFGGVLVDAAWNFGGFDDGGGVNYGNVGPLGYSSTTTDFVFGTTSDFPLATPFVAQGNLTSSTLTATENGIDTTLNGDGPPNTGILAISPDLSGSKSLFFGADLVGGDSDLVVTQLQIIYPGAASTPAMQMAFASLLVAVVDGFVWVGDPYPSSTIVLASNQSTARLSPFPTVSMAAVNYTSVEPDPVVVPQAVYFVDGVTEQIQVLNTSTFAMSTIQSKSSTAPPPTFCFLACAWRGRLVVAGDKNAPQNFYMSRAGDPSDWDYGSTDAAAAVAGNLARSGQIGEPITALIPYTDDLLLIGCAHSFWMIQGDLADGGAIVKISNTLGVVGKDAWCIDPSGLVYFIAAGGLYALKPLFEAYQPPDLVTSVLWNEFFIQQNWNDIIVSMAYDTDRHYLYMFFTPVKTSDAIVPGIHLIYDARNGGLWPTGFPPFHGPVAAIEYLSDNSPRGRGILLGGYDGYIRRLDSLTIDDDGDAINAYIVLGPYRPLPEAAMLTATTLDMGELGPSTASSTWGATMYLASGPDAFSVTQGLPHSSTLVPSVLDRRQKTYRQRLRGGWFSLRMANGVDNTYFSFENGILEFSPAGRNRERR